MCVSRAFIYAGVPRLTDCSFFLFLDFFPLNFHNASFLVLKVLISLLMRLTLHLQSPHIMTNILDTSKPPYL